MITITCWIFSIPRSFDADAEAEGIRWLGASSPSATTTPAVAQRTTTSTRAT
jgi:hypothetical protein